MTKEQRESFINWSKSEERKIRGYVCVGRGTDPGEGLVVTLGVPRRSLVRLQNGKLVGDYNGNDSSYLYYMEESKWKEIFETTQDMTIEEKIEYGKQFVGKRIVAPTTLNKGLIERVRVEIDNSFLMNPSSTVKEQVDSELEKYGCVVFFEGRWDKGNRMVRPIIEKNLELAKNSIKINGFESVDKEGYFEFGCAKISKNLLVDLKKIMTDDYAAGNRKIESVKIGAGEFTLKDINSLLDE